jgi:hypothetical protein
LKLIKEFSYCNQAEIHSINGEPLFLEKKKKTKKILNSIRENLVDFLENQITLFFNAELKTRIKKNKWRIAKSQFGYLVLAEKTKDGGWDNVKECKQLFEFEYLCARCLLSLKLIDEIKRNSEYNNYLHESYNLFSYVNDDDIKEFIVEI